MSEVYKAYYKSEIGIIEITSSDVGIKTVEFLDDQPSSNFEVNSHITKCLKEMDEYFKGERKKFTVNLDWQGTEFQKKVWQCLLGIPYAGTVSYLDIAIELGDPKAVRAVGMANNKNPIPIIVPCHRVIGADGKLIGYACGLWRKDWLLKHEKEYSGAEKQMELF